jgi:hypothetical protein
MCCFKVRNVPIGYSNWEINHLMGWGDAEGDSGMLAWGNQSMQVAKGTRALISK